MTGLRVLGALEPRELIQLALQLGAQLSQFILGIVQIRLHSRAVSCEGAAFGTFMSWMSSYMSSSDATFTLTTVATFCLAITSH